MKTEIVKKRSRIKITLIVFAITVVAFIVYFAIMSLLGPGRKFLEIQLEYDSKSVIDSTLDKRVFTDSTYLKLLKERAFLQSRTVMAATDSIYLTLDLADSSANLEISGVVVHRAKMTEIETSSILLHGDENLILNILASPFTIANSYSTILKDPVMLKMAPKDTSEYKPDIMPDTSITEPVNYIFEMTNGSRIFIYQDEVDSSIYRKSQFRFDLKIRLKDTWSSLKSVARFKVPEYKPYIKIKLPREDAKIIYRAIPRYGQVGIYK
jgi:hypothetical protein